MIDPQKISNICKTIEDKSGRVREKLVTVEREVLRVTRRTSGRGGRGIKSRVEVAHQGRTDPVGTTVIKPVPYFSSTFRVATFYECTPRPSSTSGRTEDLIATTRGNNVVKFTPRETRGLL